MQDSLRFQLKNDTDPEQALEQIAAADLDQSYTFSTSNGELMIASQIDRSSEEIRAFVTKAAGDLILQ